MRLCEAAFPDLRAVDPVYILSQANSGHQGPHTDAPAGRSRASGDTADIVALSRLHRQYISSGKVPLSVLMPLEPGGRLLIWPGSHRVVWSTNGKALPDHMSCDVIDVPLHSIVVFRQDVVHAGDGYNHSHLRSHFFLDPREGPPHRIREITGDTVTHFMDETFFTVDVASQ
jgi:hypothetical protein